MKKIIIALIPMVLMTASCAKQIIPKAMDKTKSRVYKSHLAALKEPSRSEFKRMGHESYRFLWLRSFHHPVAIRIHVLPDGSGKLILKITDGSGGYEPGKLYINRAYRISKRQIERLRQKMEQVRFMSLPSKTGYRRLDGAHWYFEVKKDLSYHWVDRWNPKGTDIGKLGLYFIRLARFKPAEVY